MEGIIRLAKFSKDFMADFRAKCSAAISIEFQLKCDEIDGGLYGQLFRRFYDELTAEFSAELKFPPTSMVIF